MGWPRRILIAAGFVTVAAGVTLSLGRFSYAPMPDRADLLNPDRYPIQTAFDILGRRVSPDDRELRRHIGIVPQEVAVYGELTARENLAFFGQLYGLTGDALRQRVAEVLEAIGLADRADSRVETFSGGMKRRLNLGAGLVHGPRLLLLDEPTVGVDPQSRNHIFEEVRRLNRGGVTVLYTSHYMEEVQALCTRVGIIDHGRLVACDTLPNLLRRVRSVIRCRVSAISPALREREAAGVKGVIENRAGQDQKQRYARNYPMRRSPAEQK